MNYSYQDFLLFKKENECRLINDYIHIQYKLNKIDEYDVEECVLKDFPIELQLSMVKNFINNPYNLDYYEITKLMYFLWEKPEFNECRKVIEDRINEIIEMDESTRKKRGFELYGTQFCHWHLFGIIPLMKNYTFILKEICKKRYNDAQELLIFAIHQLDPKKFYRHFKEIFMYWKENNNIDPSCSATGMLWQMDKLLTKYKKCGISMYLEKEVAEEYDYHKEHMNVYELKQKIKNNYEEFVDNKDKKFVIVPKIFENKIKKSKEKRKNTK